MKKWLLILFVQFILQNAFSQEAKDTMSRRVTTDSLSAIAEPLKNPKVDSVRKVHSPKKAAIRSAIIPGWGQAYNKKYWKIPIVYGALGVSGGFFVYNLNWYKRTRYAYKIAFNIADKRDSTGIESVHPDLKALVRRGEQNALLNYRNEFRRNVDYSVLYFLILWGVNVIDASVDAHLKSFDVSPDLGFKVKPGYSELAGTSGISLVLTFK